MLQADLDGVFARMTPITARPPRPGEPARHPDTANAWPVDSAYGDTDTATATGKPLGLTGLVRKYQPDAVTTLRSGWIGDFASEEGSSVPTGAIRRRTGKLAEKCFTIGGSWGYKAGASVMSFGTAMNIMVNAWVRNITCLVNVGPDRTGVVPTAQADLVRRIGSFMTTCGEAAYGTRGGPWNPVDGQYGFTSKDSTFYVGKTATASSEETSKGNTAAKAVDGSTATRWCADNGNTGNWLKVDLGATKSLTGARIAWELNATNYRYRVEGSTDNATWTTLVDRTDTTSTSQVQTVVLSAQARYARVTVTGLPTGVWASIRNLELYDRPFTADLGTYKLVNRKSGKVLDVNGASSTDGAAVIQ